MGWRRKLISSVVLMLALSGCIDTGPPDKAVVLEERSYAKNDADRILNSTGYDDPERLDKAEQLSSLGPASAATMLRVLREGEEPQREAAAYALSRTAFGLDEGGRKAVAGQLKRYLSDENDFVRQTSAGVAASLGEPQGIPVLIGFLGSSGLNIWSDPPEPYGAYSIRVLADCTGLDFGYDPYGSEEERAEAQKRWENWWEESKDGLTWSADEGVYKAG